MGVCIPTIGLGRPDLLPEQLDPLPEHLDPVSDHLDPLTEHLDPLQEPKKPMMFLGFCKKKAKKPYGQAQNVPKSGQSAQIYS